MSDSRFAAVAACAVAFMLVFGGAAQAAKGTATDKSSSGTKVEAQVPAKADHKVIVYYFHGDMRCTNCINFEKYTDELMKTTFADAIKDGSMEWVVVNTDQRGNEHFMKDYQLYTKSIVVVDAKGGKQVKFKNLTGIWQNIGNKAKFQDYVKGEIQAYLGAR